MDCSWAAWKADTPPGCPAGSTVGQLVRELAQRDADVEEVTGEVLALVGLSGHATLCDALRLLRESSAVAQTDLDRRVVALLTFIEALPLWTAPRADSHQPPPVTTPHRERRHRFGLMPESPTTSPTNWIVTVSAVRSGHSHALVGIDLVSALWQLAPSVMVDHGEASVKVRVQGASDEHVRTKIADKLLQAGVDSEVRIDVHPDAANFA